MRWLFFSGRMFRASKLQWGPTLTAHDPNPPITLESLPAGDLAGATTVTFAPAAALKAAGALSGSSSLTFTTSGTLRGAGTLSGASSLTFTAAGNLRGSGVLTGASSLTFTTAGTLRGGAPLAGTTTVSFTPAAAMAATGGLSGAAALQFTAAGIGALAGVQPVADLRSAGSGGAASARSRQRVQGFHSPPQRAPGERERQERRKRNIGRRQAKIADAEESRRLLALVKGENRRYAQRFAAAVQLLGGESAVQAKGPEQYDLAVILEDLLPEDEESEFEKVVTRSEIAHALTDLWMDWPEKFEQLWSKMQEA